MEPQKMTAETFPASPEKATLEGKNKFVGFWLFLGRNRFVCIAICHVFGAEKL